MMCFPSLRSHLPFIAMIRVSCSRLSVSLLRPLMLSFCSSPIFSNAAQSRTAQTPSSGGNSVRRILNTPYLSRTKYDEFICDPATELRILLKRTRILVSVRVDVCICLAGKLERFGINFMLQHIFADTVRRAR